MTEIQCDYKQISIDARQASFTRAANRFLADYIEVFGEDSVDDEIKLAHANIKAAKQFDDVDWSVNMDFPHYDKYCVGHYKTILTKECQYKFFWDNEDHYLLYYYFLENTRYETTYFGQKHGANDWGEFKASIYRQKGQYRYLCTQRPPAQGGIPDGFVTYMTFPNNYSSDFWYPGEATYNRLLTSDEQLRYGLRFDENWTRERNAWGFNKYDTD